MRNSTRKKFFTPASMAVLAVLLAAEIVLSRFLSVSLWNIKIGFSFIPVILAAYRFGPVGAMVVAGLGDFLGATLFPIGPYFPGFTLTAILTALCFGLFLLKKMSFIRLLCAVLIAQLVLGLLLNTLWISILYTSPYSVLLPLRAVQAVVMTVLSLLTMYPILRAIEHSPRLQQVFGREGFSDPGASVVR